MSLHFPIDSVERGQVTPAQLQEHLVLGAPPKETQGTRRRIVNFLRDMVDAAIIGAQLFSPLYDPNKRQR